MAPRRTAQTSSSGPSAATQTSSASSLDPSSAQNRKASPTSTTTARSSSASSALSSSASSAPKELRDIGEVLSQAWDTYIQKTPSRTKLVDVFMAFLVVVGALQFLYCLIGGNYPFNAFLAGFSATVGQFVLTASLRIQTNPENQSEFKGRSHER
ncbi:hypothetical protein MMC25_007623 [Agyrium rufum]|nr:hypothetical protein [Agyrium rufum]